MYYRISLTCTYSFTFYYRLDWLVVLSEEGKQQLAQPIEARMNPVFSTTHLSFIWNYFDENQNVYSWLIKFPTEAALQEFQVVFGECMYETLNQLSWDKVPVRVLTYAVL